MSGKDYLPPRFANAPLRVGSVADLIVPPAAPTVVRTVPVDSVRWNDDKDRLLLDVGDDAPLVVDPRRMMRFGDEEVSILEYLRRTYERGDLFDFIVDPKQGVTYAWTHIRYEGTIQDRESLSLKDDGLFALRAKAGEKAERIVMRHLMDARHHAFPSEAVTPPGVFVIHAEGKRQRRPDVTCQRCHLRVEVKKRNGDRRYRVSHSPGRPFASENRHGDWHCFVFPDLTLHFVSNAQILQAFDDGRASSKSDRYDGWADVDGLHDEVPHECIA